MGKVREGSVQMDHKKIFETRRVSGTLNRRLESIIGTLMINLYERRQVGIFDIPGAHLHTLVPDDKITILTLSRPGTYLVPILTLSQCSFPLKSFFIKPIAPITYYVS